MTEMMFSITSPITRRALLQGTVVASASAWLQPARAVETERAVVVAQIADMSASQQDVSRDFLIGSRAAWQDTNARGGIRGRTVQHLALDVDGSRASLERAWKSVAQNPGCVALAGCVGNTAARGILELQSQTPSPQGTLPIIAPWLHSNAESAEAVFDIFPDHREQIGYAMRSLSSMGTPQLGVVYANAATRQQARPHIQQVARDMRLDIQTLPLADASGRDTAALRTPSQAVILFVGGTPELHDFARQLDLNQGRQCYIVALGDVNLQVLAQLRGIPGRVNIIATQPVPAVTSGLPVVRAYREALGRFFDESPTPQGLAGFIAARYTAEVLTSISGPMSRDAVMTALQRRTAMQLGGFAVSYQGRKRISTTVTQSMLTHDGRIVG